MNNNSKLPPHRRLGARLLGAGLGLVVVMAAPSAHALQGGEDPTTLPVLIDKRYGNKGKLYGYALFSTPIVSKFTESRGFQGGIGYSLTDWLGVGVQGGFMLSGEQDVVDEVRRNGRAPLSDLFAPTWMVGGELTWTPIYGRISFASEYNPAFDLYVVGGGGLVGVEREVGPVDQTTSVSETTGYMNFGFGFRFHIVEMLAVRVEYRHNLIFEPAIPANELIGFEEEFEAGLLTDVPQLQLGVQVHF